jgi:hypothetical protein
MTPVYQNEGENCQVACIASILDMPMSRFPHLDDKKEGWYDDLIGWCENNGITYTYIPYNKEYPMIMTKGTYYILGLGTKDINVHHAVVCMRKDHMHSWEDWKYDVIHDPNLLYKYTQPYTEPIAYVLVGKKLQLEDGQ